MKIIQYILNIFKKRDPWFYEKFMISKIDHNDLNFKELNWKWTVVFPKQRRL